MTVRSGGAAIFALAALAVAAPVVARRPPCMTMLGLAVVAADADPSGVPVGGISGIDYDPRTNSWILISDDKSDHAPARFWRAWIAVGRNGPREIALSPATIIHTAAGNAFPKVGTGAEAIDAESIRFQPRHDLLTWSSEGDLRDAIGPSIRQMDRQGRFVSALPLPGTFAFDPQQARGPRPNLSIEGLSYTADGKMLWMAMEAPLFQDGPLSSSQEGADIRLTRIVPGSDAPPAQYVYRVEHIGATAAGRLADNGASEILAIDADHLLVLERSGVQGDDGEFAFHSRLYCADISDATDVTQSASLTGARYRRTTKALLFSFDDKAGVAWDNVEGMTWGPKLANGHRTLIFVTDDNFSPHQSTQIIVLDAGELGRFTGTTKALCDAGSE